MLVHRSSLRVRYSETDQMGHAHHSQFFNWMDVARTEFLKEVGYRYKDIEKMGIIMPVVEAYCRYRSPAYYDDLLHFDTWIDQLTRVKINFAYKITGENDVLIAEAHTLLACLDSTRRPVKMPVDVWNDLQKAHLGT